jgi:hypothetical protein
MDARQKKIGNHLNLAPGYTMAEDQYDFTSIPWLYKVLTKESEVFGDW